MDKIKDHYKKLANTLGTSKEMSMKDNFTRDAEIADILTCLSHFLLHKKIPKVLEIGCGNGYTAQKINESIKIDYTGVDFCEDLVELAINRNIENFTFITGNVLNLDFGDETYDIIFSERCLINLDSWKKQRRGMAEIYRVLKKGGIYIMIECFTDGLHNINEARRVLGLKAVEQPFHNKYFDKTAFMKDIRGKFVIYDDRHPEFAVIHKTNFLSSYYFGRSVLYPAINQNKEIEYNNKFVEFFTYMEPYGNYSYIQSLILEKVK